MEVWGLIPTGTLQEAFHNGAGPERIEQGSVAMKPKYIRNARKPWTEAEREKLRELAKGNTPTRVVGLKLGRPEPGVREKAGAQGISLKPTNRAPCTRRLR